jgi:hypothetical protein
VIARRLRAGRPHPRRHLDEALVRVAGITGMIDLPKKRAAVFAASWP